MAGEIKHSWTGTVLTITSDSGTSSCDLKGEKGDDGCRGAQGVAGAGLIDDTLSKKGFAADAQAMGEQFNILNGRIDSIIALPDGATTADAELIDLRLDYKGRIRTSAGAAVRNSFYEIDDRLKIEETTTKEIQGTQSQQEKRLINLEKRFANEPFEIDNSIEATKIVPEGAMPYAAVNKVGGMSYKAKNLIPYPYYETTKTVNGVTFTDNGDGTITANGTATGGNADFEIQKPWVKNNITLQKGKTYILSGCVLGGGENTYSITIQDESYKQTSRDIGDGAVFNADYNNYYAWLRICEGVTVNNLIFKPQLERGTQATSYEPYYSGLRNAYVSKIKSVVSKNILNLANSISDSGTYTVEDNKITFTGYDTISNQDYFPFGVWVDVKPNTNYYVDFNSTSIGAIFIYTDKLWGNNFKTLNFNLSSTHYFNSGNNKRLLLGFYSLGSLRVGTSETVSNIILSEGTEATDYEPYKEAEFIIPTGARGVGYGMGINESCYNYIDFERKVYIQNCVKVNMSTLNWTHYNGSNEGYWETEELKGLIKPAINNNILAENIIAENYYTTKYNWGTQSNCIASSTNGAIACNNKSATEKPTGFMIYELETPIETDYSDYIQDNFIEVEAGGVITAVNEYGYNVPTEYEYMIGG